MTDCTVITNYLLFVIHVVIMFNCLTALGLLRFFLCFIQFSSFGNYKCLCALIWCKAPVKLSFFFPVGLSVRVKQLEKNSTDFYEISC